MSAQLLVVVDDDVQREVMTDILGASGHAVTPVDCAEAALETARERTFDLCLTDMKMPGMDGLDLLRQMARTQPDLDVVVMTAHGTIRTAVTAMREGALDYLEKPFDKDELLHVISRALDRVGLSRENKQLRALASGDSGPCA